jgi:hypothetical protein
MSDVTPVPSNQHEPYAGPTAGALVAMLENLPPNEPVALWMYTKSDAQETMATRELSNDEWMRVVRGFDDQVCRTDDLLDQLWETLNWSCQNVVPPAPESDELVSPTI